MRIDAHTHAMHAEHDATGKLIPPLKPAWAPGPQTPKDYVKGSREFGIDQILVLDPPETTFALCEIFGDYILPSPQVDLDTVTCREIDDLFKRGACGIKFIAPMHSYGDNRYFPVYEVIRNHKGLAVFHTGYLGDGLHRPGGLLGRTDYVDINHMRPSVVDRVARAFPDLNILMAHFGNPWWEEAWKIMTSHKNIYADFSGGTAFRRSMNMWAEIFKPDGRLDTAAIGKLCFATDCSFCFQGQYPGRQQIDFYERFFEKLEVPAELRELVNWGTIQKLTAGKKA
jgi:hypothetical protein